jgi:hypothetical protein
VTVISKLYAWRVKDGSTGAVLVGFTVCGKDKVFQPAEARIVGATVVLTSEMVDAMHELDVSSITIDADGNQPPMVFEMGNHIAASIPVDWEERRRETAFDLIPDELLKIEVTAVFAKGEARIARDLAEELVFTGYTVIVKKGVHHSTLKSWVREQFENGNQLPDLESIGATIFNEVKVKVTRDGKPLELSAVLARRD